MKTMERDLYSISEAAKRLHMDVKEVKRLIREKELKVYIRGKRLYVPAFIICRHIEDNLFVYDEGDDKVPRFGRRKRKVA